MLLSSCERSLVSNFSLNEPTLLSHTETVTDTKLDVLEVIDAFINDVALFDINHSSLDGVETNSAQSLGGLFDDPIEYGDPFTDANYWRQQHGNYSCAIVAQIGIYESLTGQYISEEAASIYAQQQGWFDPNSGTQLVNTGKILDVLGIETINRSMHL